MITNLFPIFLGVSAGIFQIIGYVFYVRKIGIGRVKPNTASWSIWAFGSILESVSYINATGDWVKNLLPIACTVSALLLFFYCLFNGRFNRPTLIEHILIVLDCVAIFIWWWYQSAIFANFFLVFVAIISFLPIFVHVWRDPMEEDATPWYIWTVAYTMLVFTVLFRWERWEDLVYPLVFAVLHVIVGILSLDRRIPSSLRFKRQ